MILDEPDALITKPSAVSQGWIITYCDLVALMLTFFVMLYSVSARDPSKVDSTVSSLTEKFAKSSVTSDFGTVSSQTGSVLLDQAYLDSVISAIRGRDAFGEVKLIRSTGGTLMVRLERDKVFVPRTGILSPEGLILINDIARAMLRSDAVVALPMIEIRISGTADELSETASSAGDEAPVPVRQASRIARTLIDSRVASSSISTLILESEIPHLDIALYTVSAPERGAAVNGVLK